MPPSTLPDLPVTVEVSAAEAVSGTSEIRGLLGFDGEALVFAYQTRNLLRKPSGEYRFTMPASAVQSVRFRSGVFGNRLTVVPRRLDVLAEAPGAHRDRLVFQVRRADRSLARALTDRLMAYLVAHPTGTPDSVPFRLPGGDMGMTEYTGLLYLDETYLVLDLQQGLSGLSQSHYLTVKVEPAALRSVRYEQGLFRDTLHLRPKKDELLRTLPGEHTLEAALAVSRKHRPGAERLVAALRARMG